MRKLAKLLLLILGGLSVWYGWLLWENNRSVAPIELRELSASLERAIDWLEDNSAIVETYEDKTLHWMLKEAAESSGNPRLIPYREEYLANRIDPMLDPGSTIFVPSVNALDHLPVYNLLFIYGSTCDRQLGSEPIVLRQLEPKFCRMHFLQPRCVTHQLFGVRFMQRGHCGDPEEVEKLLHALQDIVVTELTWDPRVVDAYIQRVLTLVESGAEQRVKPVWIRRVLEAQNADGGWGDLDPIVGLPNDRAFGFSSRKLKVGSLGSNYHATAQGIWLMSLLQKKGPQSLSSDQMTPTPRRVRAETGAAQPLIEPSVQML